MIIVKKDESLDSALRRFKKETIKSGTLLELKKREYYMSPSQKRRAKSKEAQKRIRKKTKVKLY